MCHVPQSSKSCSQLCIRLSTQPFVAFLPFFRLENGLIHVSSRETDDIAKQEASAGFEGLISFRKIKT